MADFLIPPSVRRRRFTIDEYHRMAEIGVLHEDDHVELIDGELLIGPKITAPHASCVNTLSAWFITRLVDRAITSVQNPVRLPPHSEPLADVMLLRPRADHYRDELPGPTDVLLIIEVSDDSLPCDRGIKLPLFATAGIPELWIVDLGRRRVLRNRHPDGDMFREALIVDQGTLSPLAFPDLVIQLTQIFR